MKFRNITQLPNGTYQIKVYDSVHEDRSVHKTLKEAIRARNEAYTRLGIRPQHMLIPLLQSHDMMGPMNKRVNGVDVLYHRVYSKRLSDRKAKYRTFRSINDAKSFAFAWTESHNAIAALYNARRESQFKIQIRNEEEHCIPLIKIGFDEELWKKCGIAIFGDIVPFAN